MNLGLGTRPTKRGTVTNQSSTDKSGFYLSRSLLLLQSGSFSMLTTPVVKLLPCLGLVFLTYTSGYSYLHD